MAQKRWLPLLAGLACLLGWTSQAQALRCGTQLVRRGDERSAVKAICGEPLDVSRRYEQVRVMAQAPAPQGTVPVVATAVTVSVETWTYNFGPNRLMQRLTFRDGQVEQIQSLGYGFAPERAAHGRRRVRPGDSRGEVRSAWGEPADRSVRVVQQQVVTPVGRGVVGDVVRAVEVETWVFDFGPRRFKRRVVFEDGQVTSVETLGYGQRR